MPGRVWPRSGRWSVPARPAPDVLVNNVGGSAPGDPVLNVTMNEDKTRHCKYWAIATAGTHLARLEESIGSTQGRRKRAGWNDAFRTGVLMRYIMSDSPPFATPRRYALPLRRWLVGFTVISSATKIAAAAATLW